jgi:hypothetical protein
MQVPEQLMGIFRLFLGKLKRILQVAAQAIPLIVKELNSLLMGCFCRCRDVFCSGSAHVVWIKFQQCRGERRHVQRQY